MKKKIYLLSMLTLGLTFYGCDYSIGLQGRVLSNETGEPISGALVTLKSVNITVATDSLGFFYLRQTGGGKLPQAIYQISKEGYKDFEIEFSSTTSGNVTIVKTGKKNYDLGGKFFYPDSTDLSTYLEVITFEKFSQDYMMKSDSVIFYMDIDNMDIEFANFLKRRQNGGWNNDKYMIK